MNGEQIKREIDYINSEIRELLFPTQYTLNNAVSEKMKQIEQLQNECPHHFSDGYCDYCYKEETQE